MPANPNNTLNTLFLAELLLILGLGSFAAWQGQDLRLQTSTVIGAIVWLSSLWVVYSPDHSSRASWRAVLLFVTSWLVFPLFKAIRLHWISTTYDPTLLALDRALWGGRSLPEWTLALECNGLSEILSAGYMIYYFVVLLPMAWAAMRRHTTEGQAFLTGICLMYMAGFAGYLLVPAGGPYMAFPEVFAYPPQGSAITALLAGLVAQAITGMDVFPSLHSGVSVFVWGFFLLGGYRRIALLLTPVVLAIILSTVYLRYHYGVDLIAGILLAAVVLTLVQRQRRHAHIIAKPLQAVSPANP